MRVLRITREVDREELQEAIKREQHPKRRTWLEIVRFVLDGWQGKAVAAFLRLHPLTVSRVVQRFNEEGLEGLHCRCQGRQSCISGEAEAAIIERVEQALTADRQRQELIRGRDLQQMLADDYGIRVHPTTIYRRLHRLGYTVLCPRPRHPKKNDEQSAIFKKGDLARGRGEHAPSASPQESDPLFSG